MKKLVILPLPRKSAKSYRHMCHVMLEADNDNEMLEQVKDLVQEYPEAKVIDYDLAS